MSSEIGVTFEFCGWSLEGMRCWSRYTYTDEQEARFWFRKVYADYLKTGPAKAPSEPVLLRVERTLVVRGSRRVRHNTTRKVRDFKRAPDGHVLEGDED